MKGFLYLVFSTIFSFCAIAQSSNGISIWSSQVDVYIHDVASTSDGGYVTVGEAGGAISFGPNSSANLPNRLHGTIVKYLPGGAVDWHLTVSTAYPWDPESERSAFYRVATDKDNNIYIYGNCSRYIQLDPDNSGPTFGSGSAHHDYLVKYSHDGNFEWVVEFGGNDNIFPKGLFVSNQNRIHFYGRFGGTNVMFNPDWPFLGGADAIGTDIFISTYEPDGTFLYLNQLPELDRPAGAVNSEIVCSSDQNGNLLLSSFGESLYDLDPSSGEFLYQSGEDEGDLFLVRYNGATGALIDSKIWDQTTQGFAFSKDILTDNTGNIYLSGDFVGTVDFDPDSNVMETRYSERRTLFLMKLDDNFNLNWVRSWSTPLSYYNKLGHAAYDGDSIVFMVSMYLNEYDINPDTSEVFLLPNPDSGRVSLAHIVMNIDGDFISGDAVDLDDYTYFASNLDNYDVKVSSLGTPLYHGLFHEKAIFGLSSTSDSLVSTYNSINNTYTIDGFVYSTENCYSNKPQIVNTGYSLSTPSSLTSLQWMSCSNGTMTEVANEVDSVFYPINNGSYALVYIKLNGCSDTTGCFDVMNTGIMQNSDRKLSLIPNPSDGHFILKGAQFNDSYRLYNSIGQVLANGRVEIGELNLTLTKGVYYLEVTGDESSRQVLSVVIK